MKLAKLAKLCNLVIAGDKKKKIRSLAYASEARAEDMAVVFSARELEDTKASVVLAEPVMCCDTDKTLVYSDYGGIFTAVSEIIHVFIQAGYYKDYRSMPHYISRENGVLIGRHVKIGNHSEIYPGVTIGDDVYIGEYCCIEPNVFIGSGTYIGHNCIIHSGARIGVSSFLHYDEKGKTGCFSGIGLTILGNGVQVGSNTVIQRGTLSDTIIEDGVLIGNLVVVGHDVKIGRDSQISCQTGLAGRSMIGSHVNLMGQSGVSENVRVEDFSIILGKSAATRHVARGQIISGRHGRENEEELRIQAFLRRKYRRK